LRVIRNPDLKAFDPGNELFQENVSSLLSDRHRHRHRHAAFAGRAVARTDEGIDGLIEVGVGHDNHVVLGAAKALDPLSVCAPGRVDVFGDCR
jgi:hypothetical protein